MSDPTTPPLNYQTPSIEAPRFPRLCKIGLVLILIGAAGFVCTVVGIALAYHRVSTSPNPAPNDLAAGISNAMCFTSFGIVLAIIGVVFRIVGARPRRR